MSKLLICVLATGFFFSCSAKAATLRCGSDLVSLGDRGFEIKRKCGEPAYRDTVGYTVGPNQRLELAVEEWVYGPRNGMTYILRLEGNRLVHIEGKRLP
ncbi:MAG: DUF2845 domain-containing protein [Gammaproteobacteria bacterium]|jgi:hypothetical protein|nr:DUF2845 domain-containing protein [Gammaproteobacteria bacterium]